MDLATAKREASARSLATKKKVFVNLKDDGSHELFSQPGKQPMLLYINGAEATLPEKKSTPVKKPAVKKEVKKPTPVKKVSAKRKTKKVMKKVSKKSAQKIVNRVAVPTKGKNTTMTAKQLRNKVLEGKHVFNSRGREIPCSLMAKNEPAKKLSVVVTGKGYFITK